MAARVPRKKYTMPLIPDRSCNIAAPSLHFRGMITNLQSGTRIDEIADGIYRINTPVRIDALPGGFNFSQYLIVDDEPVLFHTGLRRMFSLVAEAISKVIPVARLRYLG